MIEHIDRGFLTDAATYAHSEEFWRQLWDRVDESARKNFGWVQPWFQPLPRELAEGNPVFSAVSSQLCRGIRVIQYEPTRNEVEIQAWLDSFGGGHKDSSPIDELVISCALSNLSAEIARGLMIPWVQGKSVTFGQDGSDPDLGLGAASELPQTKASTDFLHASQASDR
jgi:hypothetical protein